MESGNACAGRAASVLDPPMPTAGAHRGAEGLQPSWLNRIAAILKIGTEGRLQRASRRKPGSVPPMLPPKKFTGGEASVGFSLNQATNRKPSNGLEPLTPSLPSPEPALPPSAARCQEPLVYTGCRASPKSVRPVQATEKSRWLVRNGTLAGPAQAFRN
jgi:hypothetical protein